MGKSALARYAAPKAPSDSRLEIVRTRANLPEARDYAEEVLQADCDIRIASLDYFQITVLGIVQGIVAYPCSHIERILPRREKTMATGFSAFDIH